MSAVKARGDRRDAIESLCQPPQQWWAVMSKAQNSWLGGGAEYWRQVEAALRRDGASLKALLDAQNQLAESLLQYWLASASRVWGKPEGTKTIDRPV